ncbi:MAG: hypothetical protein ABUK01_02805 [Leptospirales bacterium]
MKAGFLTIGNYIYNSILPERCPVCMVDFVPPGKPLCINCLHQFITSTPGSFISTEPNALLARFNMEERIFYFAKWHYIWEYNQSARVLYRAAKFNRRRLSEKQIEKAAYKILFSNLGNYPLYPLPSSYNLISRIIKKIGQIRGQNIEKVFYKKKKGQIKKKEKNIRYLEIENSLCLDLYKIDPAAKANKVYVIDDLWSTGATMNKACMLLCQAGFQIEQIEAVVLFFNPERSKNDA